MATVAPVPDQLRDLQERAAQALPARHVERLDGWWLRHTDSSAWWISTVLPHGDAPPAELPGKIQLTETFYASRRTPSRFQITPGACPADLDRALAERGYRRESPMSLQVAPTTRIIDRLAATLPTRLAAHPTDVWFETWRAVHGSAGDPTADRAILRRVQHPSAYVSALTPSGVAAVGRAVAQSGWAGIFGMATLPHLRGRGAATTVLAALAHWAHTHGVTHLYLQVERDNPAAHHLYHRAGFTELSPYHYRTAPTRTARSAGPDGAAGATTL